MLPGGSICARPILAHLGRPGTSAFSAASRVSISELLGSGPVETREEPAGQVFPDLPGGAATHAPPRDLPDDDPVDFSRVAPERVVALET